jgi:AraC-like DNA-binding protein
MATGDLLISLSDLARIAPWTERLGLPPGHRGAVWPPPVRQAARARLYYHRHPELEANLVVSGTGAYLAGDRMVPLRPHSLVFLFPGQDHCLVRRTPDLRFLIAVWRPELVRSAVARTPAAVLAQADPSGSWCRTLPLARSRAVQRLAAELAGVADAALLDAGLAHLLLRLWSEFAAAPEDPGASALHPAVVRAAQVLGDPIRGRDASAASLARELGLSADHLGRLFRRQLGLSLPEYRNQRCLDRFLDRMRPGGNCLQEALAAGFGSYAQFHRVFRGVMGLPPRRWLTGDAG